MRLYESGGKIVAVLDETIELCDSGDMDTLQGYREMLLEKVAGRFDRTVARAALRGMGENVPKPAPLCAGLTETVTDEAKSVTDVPEIVIDNTKNVTDIPENVIDNAKTVLANSETAPGIEKPKHKRRRGIDTGKIMALKHAGWTNKEIAAEMRMEPQQVASALYRYKKKMAVLN